MTECNFCIPQLKDIFNITYHKMTTDELVAIRSTIEIFGDILGCQKEGIVCLPLLRISHEIDKRNGFDNKRK